MIDLKELRQAIIKMTPRQNIYKVIKEELLKQDHWQNHARGNPKAGYRASQTSATTSSDENRTYTGWIE